MRIARFAIFALAVGAAAACGDGPIGSRVSPQVTFTPPAVVNPGAGASVTVAASVKGAEAGARLQWMSLDPAVVLVEPTEDERRAVLRFAAQRSAAVELAIVAAQGVVLGADTLRIASISSVAPDAASSR